VDSSNVVPITSKLKSEAPAPVTAAELASSLSPGASVNVCQGKTCSKKGSAQVLEELKSALGGVVDVSPCKCLDKCKLGPNIQIEDQGRKHVLQVANAPKRVGV
jgi:hypothetical protein